MNKTNDRGRKWNIDNSLTYYTSVLFKSRQTVYFAVVVFDLTFCLFKYWFAWYIFMFVTLVFNSLSLEWTFLKTFINASLHGYVLLLGQRRWHVYWSQIYGVALQGKNKSLALWLFLSDGGWSYFSWNQCWHVFFVFRWCRSYNGIYASTGRLW